MSATLLLVEDHDANREMLKRRLARRGYTVNEAADGAEAVAQYPALRPDCIIMDLSMPNMTGIEALERIRGSEEGAHVPAIALTAHAIEAMREKCLETGFDAFLTKPVDFQALLASIEDLLAKSRERS